MLSCPRCSSGRLQKQKTKFGLIWDCRDCSGRTLNLAVLKKMLPADALKVMWRETIKVGKAGKLPCPSCESPMKEFKFDELDLDLCQYCHLIWFDQKELSQLLDVPFEETIKPLKPDAVLSEPEKKLKLEAVTLKVKRMAEKPAFISGDLPPNMWLKLIPALLFPVEHNNYLKSKPWATWGLAALIAIVSWFSFQDLKEAVLHLGFIPDQATRYFGLNLITLNFVHADYWHLISNLYFLVVFGDNIEDTLSEVKFLSFFFFELPISY